MKSPDAVKRNRFSDVVAAAVDAALFVHSDSGMQRTRTITGQDWFAMYHAQCEATDALAKKAAAKSDATLLARIAELEQQIATLNQKIVALNDTELRRITKESEVA